MELFTGEHLALDLLNTATRDFDALEDPELWFQRQRGRLAPPSRGLGVADVAAVRALREHLGAAVDAVRHGRPVPPAAIHALNHAARAAPSYPVLLPDLCLVTRRDGDDRTRLLAELGDAALDLLADPRAGTIRGCEGPGCLMLFLSAHPGRRWCSPTLCGNRARVARHYQRHRTSGPGR